jgi:hypothetical protein
LRYDVTLEELRPLLSDPVWHERAKFFRPNPL